MTLFLMGLAGALAGVGLAWLAGAPVWAVLLAYPLGGLVAIAAAALPRGEASDAEEPEPFRQS